MAAWPPDDWPDFDPILQDVPLVATPLTALTVQILGYSFVNKSGVARKVTVRDAAGKHLLYLAEVPTSGIPLKDADMGMMGMIGVTWFADGANVEGKVWAWVKA